MKYSKHLAAATLVLLPAISVELLSGNTPLGMYFSPITFVILNIIYGCTLLLIRESVVRWEKGFASILVLAAGYGMLNEALGSKGFFDPHFYSAVDFGLEGFGRVFGINVPWALDISIVHAVFSILVPFNIVTTIFPGNNKWIGGRLYVTLLVLLIAVTIFLFQMVAIPPGYYHYDEGPGPIMLIIVLMALVILAAWKMPEFELSKWDIRPSAVALCILGFVYTMAFIFLPFLVQRATGSPLVYELFLVIFFVALPVLLMFKLRPPPPSGKMALTTGVILPWILFGILQHTPGSVFAVVVVLVALTVAFFRARASGS